MDSMMQMAYMSFATRQFKMDVDNNVNAILEEARAHNSEAGITGLLVYRNGVFVQLLEGEKEVVQRVLGKILLDHSRHENLRVLLKQELIERVFPDWSMFYKKLDDEALDLVNSIFPWQRLMQSSNTGNTVPPERIFKLFAEMRA